VRQSLGKDAPCVLLDFTRTETFAPALDGVDRVFLVRPPHLADAKRYFAPFIDAAKTAGVRHIVFLSVIGVEHNHTVPHYRIEQLILASGIPYTFLRASFFMQNLNTTHRDEIRTRGEIIVPAGRSKTSFIDVRDIGAVAAQALTQAGHENRTYTLTGAEALDYYQVAYVFSSVLGRAIRYTNPSIASFFRYQRSQGKPFGVIAVMIMLYTLTRFGMSARTTPETAALLDRSPIPLRQYVEDYCAAWL
jgi:uncharacterized protein YbjT (DUF2867 family)